MNSYASISQLLCLSYIGNEAADRRNIESAIEALLARLAAVEAERDAARAGEARAVAALEKIFIGGNHLASALTHMLGDDFLEYETDFNQACEILNDPIKYDLWVCWAVIMRVRDSLSDPQPTLEAARSAAIAWVDQQEGRNV